MRNLLQFLFRYGGFFIFITLELFCLLLILQYNQKQQVIWASSINAFSGYVDESVDNVTTYFALTNIVDSLARENANLKEVIFNAGLNDISPVDTSENSRQKFQTIAAKVINYSLNKNHNYLTLNKGFKDGIQEHAGVIGSNGIIGVVRKVAANYSLVLPLIHRQSSVSASIKRNNYRATLVWKGNDTDLMNLDFVPRHIDIVVGDTIMTSGASAMFPADIMIGTIRDKSEPPGSNFYDISVDLVNDFIDLSYVYVVVNLEQKEQKKLEEEFINE